MDPPTPVDPSRHSNVSDNVGVLSAQSRNVSDVDARSIVPDDDDDNDEEGELKIVENSPTLPQISMITPLVQTH